MDSKNTHLILFSAAFLVLGFLLGRVTGHHGPRAGHGKNCCAKAGHAGCESHEGHGDFHWVGADDAEVQVMMLTDEEFEGDTVFELPGGGKVNVVRNGDEYEVEVDIEEEMDGEVRVEKRVIVVTEED